MTFTRGTFTLRATSLYAKDHWVISAGVRLPLLKAGEPSRRGQLFPNGTEVQALERYQGQDWICRYPTGVLAYVHPNKILRGEASFSAVVGQSHRPVVRSAPQRSPRFAPSMENLADVEMSGIRRASGGSRGKSLGFGRGLSKADTFELCERLGRQRGLYPSREVGPVPYLRRGVPTNGRIDVVWFTASGARELAIEIEGRNVTKDSIQNDLKKFREFRASRSVIVLFQVDNDGVTPKGHIADPVRRCRAELERLGASDVEVLMDEDLLGTGGESLLGS